MFCTNCGTGHEQLQRYCRQCGWALPAGQEAGAAAAGDPSQQTFSVPSLAAGSVFGTQSQAASWSSQGSAAPYAVFVSVLLALVFALSALAFSVAHASACDSPVGSISAICLLPLSGILAWLTVVVWKRLQKFEGQGLSPVGNRRGKLAVVGVFLAVFSFLVATLTGHAIGQSGAETEQLVADLEEMTSIGGKISKSRNAVEPTIVSYVTMYKSIQPDVAALEPILRRLQKELAIYDMKFPDQRRQTSASIANVETSLRRVQLLRRQLEVANALELIPSDQQNRVWREKMLPLLFEEERLDSSK